MMPEKHFEIKMNITPLKWVIALIVFATANREMNLFIIFLFLDLFQQ